MTAEPKFPEHDRMKAVNEKSQAIGEFIEWMNSKGWIVCEYDKYDSLMPVHLNIENTLAEYFKIDLNKIEKEKRVMLDYMRELNKK